MRVLLTATVALGLATGGCGSSKQVAPDAGGGADTASSPDGSPDTISHAEDAASETAPDAAPELDAASEPAVDTAAHDAGSETAGDAAADVDAASSCLSPPTADCPETRPSIAPGTCQPCSGFGCPVVVSCDGLDVYVRDTQSMSVIGICYYDPATGSLVGSTRCQDRHVPAGCDACSRVGRIPQVSCLSAICAPRDAGAGS